MAGKIDNKYPLNLSRKGAAFPVVSKVEDKSETLEGDALEKPVPPDLESTDLV